MRQIASLTVARARWSTFGHGPGFRQQERRAALGLGQVSAEGLARFPFPPHGRIPNFAGAEVAAAWLLDIEPWKSATAVKVNPDSPQRPLRAEALRRGITIFVPTPRLRGGFKKLDPRHIPPDKIEEAVSLSRGNRWSEEVALAEMPELGAIVCGSVAVTRDGRRCGKGEGYSDLEFAILRELGHPPVPVATTVHDLQVVASVPRDPTDQPLSVIATPTHAIRIKRPNRFQLLVKRRCRLVEEQPIRLVKNSPRDSQTLLVASDGFAEFLCDQLAPLGRITMRRIFGKTGVFCDGFMLGMVRDNTLYFRVDDDNRAAFAEAASFPPLNYEKKGSTIDLSFWRAPERLFDEPDELVAWARAALAAARRVAAKREPTARRRKSTPQLYLSGFIVRPEGPTD